jgi:acetoacetyl-CoA synthetase
MDEGGTGVKGKRIEDGISGELVATAPFPNMPVTFLSKDGNQKYWNSYLARFDGQFLLPWACH